MGSPGPATISLTAAGSAYGARRCAGYLAGLIAGTTAVLVAVAAGLTTAVLAVPAIRLGLLAAAAVYLAWLAWHIATAPPLAAAGAAGHAPSPAAGALLGVSNPKAWLAIAAVFASAHLAADPVTDAAAKTVVLTTMIVVISTTWLLAGAALAPMLRDARISRAVNIVLALALVGATGLALAHQV